MYWWRTRSSAATTYTDNEVAASTTYTYRIKAINEHGVSERSRWVHIDTPAPPVPDKPTGLEATASHGSGRPSPGTTPRDDSITGYVILRRLPGVNDTGGPVQMSSWRTRVRAAITYTDDTVAAEHHVTPTGSRPSTSTGPASGPAGCTSTLRQPRSRYRGLCRRGSHMHRRRPEAVQRVDADHERSGPVGAMRKAGI